MGHCPAECPKLAKRGLFILAAAPRPSALYCHGGSAGGMSSSLLELLAMRLG